MKCSGGCCERFYFPLPAEAVEYAKLHPEHYFGKWPWSDQDIKTSLDMIVYHGEPSTHPFGCRHFDKITRLCSIYDRRPSMCRDHGERTPCHIKGCASFKERQQRV